MIQEDHDVVIAWAVDNARVWYSAGERPSEIIRRLAPVFVERLHYCKALLFVSVFHTAFDLSLIECKGADTWWLGDDDLIDDAGIDGYLIPLIERHKIAGK